jgi:hypothetical protein
MLFSNLPSISFVEHLLFATYEDGKYSDLPHILSFMNRSYKEIFDTLFTNEEIFSLLSPFKTAYENKAFDQLEGGRNVENLSLKIGDQRKVSGCFRATKWN